MNNDLRCFTEVDAEYKLLETKIPVLVDSLSFSFRIATYALIMPFKLILFTIHNYLTKRDYSYSVDDISDLAIAVCVGVWIYLFDKWSNEDTKGFPADTKAEAFVINAVQKTISKEFQLMPFLAAMVLFIWGRFILMLQLTK